MKENEVSLKDVVIKKDENLASRFSKMEALKAVEKIRDESSAKFSWIKWPKLYNEILKKLSEALDINIISIITDAWIKNDVFNKIKEVKEARKDETVIVPLTEHSIDSEYKPYIEIMYNDTVIGKIDFEVDLTLTLKAVLLKIKNKMLLEIDAGECILKGTLKCESVEITKFSSTIKVPGTIDVSRDSLGNKEELSDTASIDFRE